MALALKLVPPRAPAPIDPVALLSDKAKLEAERCLAIIRPALVRIEQGVSQQAAAKWLAGSADGMPSWKTLQRWIGDYRSGGLVCLASQYKGRQRQDYGWEGQALLLFNSPERPCYATVAYWLRKDGHVTAAEHLVRRYLQAAPSHLTVTGRKRVGGHYHDQNIRPHVIRDNTKLPVGFIYEGDGHCCDVYVAHPATGKPVRPELTVWIDVRSHYVVAWWMSESESALTTLYSLSDGLVRHDNVPGFVHTDPGSGFKARMISHEVTGFLARFNIDLMLSLPGNAKGKGLVEGWFRWFEERCGKRFKTFCGHDRTDDFLRHLSEKVKRGDIVLPTLQQYIDAVRTYIADYNSDVQDELGCAPATLWAQLEPVRLHTSAEAVIRPRAMRTVRRSRIELEGRVYEASELKAYNTRQVIVEYSIHNDDQVWIQDESGRFICHAHLVSKKDWLPESRIEQKQQERLAAQHKRHQLAMDEQTARSRVSVATAASALDALESPAEPIAIAAPTPTPAPLALGHSFTTIVVKPEPSAPGPALTRGLDRGAELFAELDQQIQIPDDAFLRFELWQQLQQQIAGGEPVPEQLASWVASYAALPECAGFRLALDDFN